jgi:hypothetical protein
MDDASPPPLPSATRAEMSAWNQPEWLLGDVPANYSGLAQIACFAMCRDDPGEDTLPWVSRQMRKCGGWSLLSNFDDEHIGVRRIHPGYNATRYLHVDRSITNGTSGLLTTGTHGYTIPGCRLNMEIGLLWVARAMPSFEWYVNIDPDVVLFPELLPVYFSRFGGPPGGVVGANWLPFGSFALTRLALLRIIDPTTGWRKACRQIPRTIRNQDHHLRDCFKLLSVRYCSANTRSAQAACMPTNCSFPYGPWLGTVDPTWYTVGHHGAVAPPWRTGASTAQLDILHDMFEDFVGGGHCAAGIIGFHPVKDKHNHSHMLRAFYSRNTLGIRDAAYLKAHPTHHDGTHPHPARNGTDHIARATQVQHDGGHGLLAQMRQPLHAHNGTARAQRVHGSGSHPS